MISTLRYLAGTALLLLLLAACQKADTPFYSTDDDVYFSVVRDNVTYDTSIVTFAYTPATEDTTVVLKVATLGVPVKHERIVSYRVVDTSANAAVLHTHYELPARLVVPADSVNCYIPVVMHKTPDMAKRTFSITLQLEPNDQFHTRLQVLVKDKNNHLFTSLVKHVIMVDNKLNKPARGWYDDFYGPFSTKKMLLMSELLELSVQELYTKLTNADPGATNFYANYLKIYLKDMEAAGTPVLEDDGTPMKLGKYMQ
ncbi:protein of unknown function [Chitinophaga eiseniae]|uniref:DUF4843 domain-containing protein n=1 Tax=Chitinophaga eiseniae TaxID=634771 RepID=A0A1T4QUA1_9BACT|nr:DUF4843 domain-containing protein [Chitinophaga eiseniae]SKA07379.1 protein of unknown function [Chitinophaga eiseniae]